MKRSALALGVSVAGVLTSLLGGLGERDALACGGCFHPPTQTQSDITDERMLLSVSPLQTTLYDQIRYAGSPASFAWVLPIHGTVDVGLSADVLFDSIDTLTATQIQAPLQACPSLPSSCSSNSFAAPQSAGAAGEDTTVTVSHAENVGPYATVQLHATDSSALNKWLTDNGFEIPTAVTPVIDEYVKEGFDFLAMKLLPNQGVQAMRPVRVTMPGASTSLPLRMAAIGTGATVGITIWVVSDGRYEPQNFPFFHIEDADLIWDWTTEQSNYTTLRATHEAELKGKGWEIESAITLNQSLISNVILSGGQYYGGGGGGVAQPSNAGDDYLPVTTSSGADGGADGGGDAGVTETADQVRNDDITALFAGIGGPNVMVTRMRSDIAHAAMTADFVLQASKDQTELSNVRQVTQSINLTCPIYDNCSVVGTGTQQEAQQSVDNANAEASGGCVAAPLPTRDSGTRYGMLVGALGLVAFRVIRSRRDRARAKKS